MIPTPSSKRNVQFLESPSLELEAASPLALLQGAQLHVPAADTEILEDQTLGLPFGAEGQGQTSRQAGRKRITPEKPLYLFFFFCCYKKKSLSLSELTTATCCLGNGIVQAGEELRPSFCPGRGSGVLL